MALDEKACREAGNVFRILFNSWVRVPATAFAFFVKLYRDQLQVHLCKRLCSQLCCELVKTAL
jgi:hypothetical protein